jgi:hypothetical protein
MIRSVLSVLAGIVVLTVTSFAIEAVADPLLTRMFPQALPDHAAISHNLPASLLMFVYTSLCVVAGGYVTGWLARRHPAQHAVVMGVVQAALTIWAMIALPDVAPLRNWIVSIFLAIPMAWFGGFLRAKQLKRRV